MRIVSFSQAVSAGILHQMETLEHGAIRMQRYSYGLTVTDTANAGKRSKACSSVDVETVKPGSETDCNILCAELVEMLAQGANFEQLAAHCFMGRGECRFTRHALRGVDVRPSGVATLLVQGPTVSIEVTHDGFTVRDLTDPNESTAIPRKARRTAVSKLRRWLVANTEAAKALRFWDVVHAMRDNGIDCHVFCAVD